MTNLVIGKILKAQGIKGELKVLPITNDINRFKMLKNIYIGNDLDQYEIEKIRIDLSYVYIKLKGYEDRNAVEHFRDRQILIPRSESTKLPKGSYFIVDLLNSKVFVDEKEIGVLKNIHQYATTDTYEVKLKNNKLLMFPALKKVIKKIDIKNKVIVLNSKTLEEVAVYED